MYNWFSMHHFPFYCLFSVDVKFFCNVILILSFIPIYFWLSYSYLLNQILKTDIQMQYLVSSDVCRLIAWIWCLDWIIHFGSYGKCYLCRFVISVSSWIFIATVKLLRWKNLFFCIVRLLKKKALTSLEIFRKKF